MQRSAESEHSKAWEGKFVRHQPAHDVLNQLDIYIAFLKTSRQASWRSLDANFKTYALFPLLCRRVCEQVCNKSNRRLAKGFSLKVPQICHREYRKDHKTIFFVQVICGQPYADASCPVSSVLVPSSPLGSAGPVMLGQDNHSEYTSVASQATTHCCSR